jgi:hypothetical protein
MKILLHIEILLHIKSSWTSYILDFGYVIPTDTVKILTLPRNDSILWNRENTKSLFTKSSRSGSMKTKIKKKLIPRIQLQIRSNTEKSTPHCH